MGRELESYLWPVLLTYSKHPMNLHVLAVGVLFWVEEDLPVPPLLGALAWLASGSVAESLRAFAG